MYFYLKVLLGLSTTASAVFFLDSNCRAHYDRIIFSVRSKVSSNSSSGDREYTTVRTGRVRVIYA